MNSGVGTVNSIETHLFVKVASEIGTPGVQMKAFARIGTARCEWKHSTWLAGLSLTFASRTA